MHDETSTGAWYWVRHSIGRRTAHLSPTAPGLLWTSAAGLQFSVLNAIARELTQRIDLFQSQFLRDFFGLLVLLPIVARRGLAACRPNSAGAQFTRGAVHTLGLCLWYVALPKIPLADTSATHSVKFLDLVWATLLGWLLFAQVPSLSTVMGGALICAATVWVAHREARRG